MLLRPLNSRFSQLNSKKVIFEEISDVYCNNLGIYRMLLNNFFLKNFSNFPAENSGYDDF